MAAFGIPHVVQWKDVRSEEPGTTQSSQSGVATDELGSVPTLGAMANVISEFPRARCMLALLSWGSSTGISGLSTRIAAR